jgi:hypothetical protein
MAKAKVTIELDSGERYEVRAHLIEFTIDNTDPIASTIAGYNTDTIVRRRENERMVKLDLECVGEMWVD